jgi:TonB-linked SusC/RagA family outer membrane protein
MKRMYIPLLSMETQSNTCKFHTITNIINRMQPYKYILLVAALIGLNNTKAQQPPTYPAQTDSIFVTAVYSGQIQKTAVYQVEQAMNGTLPGVYSLYNGGHKFGLSNYDFFVRGKATTGSNAPLVLIDGVDGNMSLLDPNEIESISVLTDAADLAWYGMRGANGVILVTTRNGISGEKWMQLSLRTGMQTPVTQGTQLNAFQYASLYNEASINDGGNQVYQASNYSNSNDPFRYPDNQLAADFLSDQAAYHEYHFAAGGGNDIAQYFTLVSYSRQDGLFKLPGANEGLKKSYSERYNFRTNLNINLGKGFELISHISAIYNDRRSPWIGSNYSVNATNNFLYNNLYSLPALAFPIFNPDGSLGGTAEYRNNPMGQLRAGHRIENTRQLSANILLTKSLSFISPGLSIYAGYAFENLNSYFKGNYTTFAVYKLNDDDSYTTYGADDTKVTSTGGQMSDYYSNATFRSGLHYDQTKGNHTWIGKLGIQQFTSWISGDRPPLEWLGTSGTINYSYDHRYKATLSASYQGSNSYAYGKRYGFFPAASVAWIVTNEAMMATQTSLQHLQVRASTGLVGNDQTGGTRFMHRQTFYNAGGYGFGIPNGTTQGAYEGTLGNPDARWETALISNLGIDMITINNQLYIRADYFNEQRSGILIDQANITPSLIGISLPQYNAGIIHNQGFQLATQFSQVLGATTLNLGGHLLHARNTIVDLKELPYPTNETYRYRRGQPINARFGLEADGLYVSQADIDAHGVVSTFGALRPGDIKYIDQNGDGIIDNADYLPIGNAFPALIYGFNLGMQVRQFDAMVQLEGSTLFDVHQRPQQFSNYAWENRWNDEAPGTYPRLSLASDHNSQLSTYWQEKAHLLRISTIDIGYNLPQQLVNRATLSSARCYVNLHNIFSTLGSREKRDMEAPNAGFSEYPLMKAAVMGVTIKF